MAIPAISVWITKLLVRDAPQVEGWSRFPVRYVPLALLLMPIFMHGVMVPTALVLGRLHWQAWLTAGADGLYHTPADLGWGALSRTGLVARMAVNAIAGLLIVSILALFEEIGWRGWLLSQLLQRAGTRTAVLFCSMIWAVWHIPFAWAGILHLDGVPIAWTILLVPLGVFGSGLVIGWLWLRTRSLWIVAVSHGALNNWGQYAFKFTTGNGLPSDGFVFAAGALALMALGTLLLSRPANESGTEKAVSP